MANQDKIIVKDNTGDGSFREFLEVHLCTFLDPGDSHWKEKVIEQSPSLAPYIIKGRGISNPPDLLRLVIPNPYTSTEMALRSWDLLLKSLSAPIALICSLGASKAFINLLKIWVEERKGREITIKRGELKIVIKGGVTQKQLNQVIEIFEKQFVHSKVIKP